MSKISLSTSPRTISSGVPNATTWPFFIATTFVAAEQAIVKAGRALLIERWGLDRIVVKGYWKRNESEHHAPH